MSLARRNPRRDENEAAIVAELRAAGCLVERISGPGVPDLLVWAPARGAIVLLEVKRPSQRKRLSDVQKHFRDAWCDAPVYLITSTAEALAAVTATATGKP